MAPGGPGRLRAIRYHGASFEERQVEPADVPALLAAGGVVWLDIASPDAAQLTALQQTLALHPLAVADAAHPPQRPRYATWAGFELFVLVAAEGGALRQVSLFLGDGWVLTVREGGDPCEPVRRRLRERIGQIRDRGAASLAAALITTLIEGFFEPVETLREELEELEDTLLAGSARPASGRLHHFRRRLLHLRRAVVASREAIQRAVREESPRWDADARLHLREAGDDAAQLQEMVEAAQSAAVSLGDLYLTVLGSRTNEVVTVLTLVSTLFLPMTFLTGVWGMNFDRMPELDWRWGYLFAWGCIVLSAAALLGYFRQRGWFRAIRLPWDGAHGERRRERERRGSQ